MRKLVPFFVLVLLFSAFAVADLCEDQDGGRKYAVRSKVKYGLTSEEDRCVVSPGAEMRVETSLYLKEYYCGKDDKRESEVIDCYREGYSRCYQGECVGGEKGGGDDNDTGVPAELPRCGDKKVNQAAEECDPPGKICYTESFAAGICNEVCKCDPKLKDVVKPTNETVENATENITEPEEPEEEPVEISEPEEPEEEEPEVVEPVDIEPEPTVPEKIAEAKPKGFFGRLWAWLKGLFN